jgi:hypothetical protein
MDERVDSPIQGRRFGRRQARQAARRVETDRFAMVDDHDPAAQPGHRLPAVVGHEPGTPSEARAIVGRTSLFVQSASVVRGRRAAWGDARSLPTDSRALSRTNVSGSVCAGRRSILDVPVGDGAGRSRGQRRARRVWDGVSPKRRR